MKSAPLHPKKRNGIREGVRVTVSKLVFPPNSPTVQFDTTPTQSPSQPGNGQCSIQYLYNDLQYHWPATYLLEPLNNPKKMRSFFGIITPAVHDQIHKFRPHIHACQVWAKRRVLIGHYTLNDIWKNKLLRVCIGVQLFRVKIKNKKKSSATMARYI